MAVASCNIYRGLPIIKSNGHHLPPPTTARIAIDLIFWDVSICYPIWCNFNHLWLILYSKHYYYQTNQPGPSTHHLPPSPLAIATRILYADGADPYIQVTREDRAYGVDDQRVYYCMHYVHMMWAREGSVECGLEEVVTSCCWLFQQ